MGIGIVKKLIIAVFISLSFSLAAFIISIPFTEKSADTSFLKDKPKNSEQPKAGNNTTKADDLTMLYVKGNKITNAGNGNVRLKGIMPPDLLVLKEENRFSRALFEGIRETGANVVRIPVHPDMWIKDENYLKDYIAPAVAWSRDLGMYAIVDLHYIGNIVTGEGSQMPKIDKNPNVLAREFWTEVSSYFNDTPNVIFEICNEPADISARQWSEGANDLVDIIRSQGAKQLIIVGGIQYSQDLSWVLKAPVRDANIAYASHIYPAHNQINWDSWFGGISKTYPVIITEWGFIDENRNNTKQQYLVGDEVTYGKPLLDYLDRNNIGWVACWYDDTWEPQMFRKGFDEYTNYGRFVFENLSKSNN